MLEKIRSAINEYQKLSPLQKFLVWCGVASILGFGLIQVYGAISSYLFFKGPSIGTFLLFNQEKLPLKNLKGPGKFILKTNSGQNEPKIVSISDNEIKIEFHPSELRCQVKLFLFDGVSPFIGEFEFLKSNNPQKYWTTEQRTLEKFK